MLTKKDREAIRKMMDDYGHSEAEKYLERQKERRREHVKEIESALEVISPTSEGREALESKLVALLLGQSVNQEVIANIVGDGGSSANSGKTPNKRDASLGGQYL